jgi:membrane protease YdiL (CAAX protease family)
MEPPPVIETAPPAAPQRPGAPITWAALGLIFALLIAAALFSHYTPKEATGPERATTGIQLRMALAMRSLVNAEGGASARRTVESQLATVADALEPQAKRNEFDALNLLVIQRLANEEKLSEAALANLQDSENPQLKAAGDFYADPKRDAAQTLALAEKFGERGSAWSMARAQAKQQAGEIADAGESLSFASYAGLFVMLGLFGVVVVVGFIALPTGLILAGMGRWKAAGFVRGGISKAAADAAAGLAAIYFLCYLMLPMAARFLIPSSVPPLVATAIAFTGLAVIAGVLGFRLAPKLGIRWGEPARPWVQGLTGFLGMPANWPILLALGAIIAPFINNAGTAPTHPLTDAVGGGLGPMEAAAALILAAVYAPFIEEIIFRGLILSGLKERLGGFWIPNLIQAFLFAAIHPQGPLLWPMLGAIGFTAGWLTHRTGSLWPAIIMHGLHNGMLVLLNLALSG